MPKLRTQGLRGMRRAQRPLMSEPSTETPSKAELTSPATPSATRTRAVRGRYVASGLIASAVLLAFIGYAVTRAVTAAPPTQSFPSAAPSVIPAGKSAPLFSLPPLNGTARVDLRSLLSRPVVVNFFASWCTECRAELGAMAAVARTYDRSVHFVGIDSSDRNFALSRQLLKGADAAYPVGLDPHGVWASVYLVSALPVTLFVDTAGRVVGELYGKQSIASLNKAVRGLLTYPRST